MKAENEKTRQLILKTLKLLSNIVDVNGEKNIGICKAGDKETDVYVLGDNIFKSPIEIYIHKEKGMYGVLFYNTLEMKNWTMTLREAYKSYFIYDGKYCTENGNKAIVVPTKQVHNELRVACESYIRFKGFTSKFITMG